LTGKNCTFSRARPSLRQADVQEKSCQQKEVTNLPKKKIKFYFQEILWFKVGLKKQQRYKVAIFCPR
jgi:hypothetical protein